MGGVLSERDLDVLAALPTDAWVRPMDVGGTDASYHSATLRKLVRCGLAEKKRHHVGVSGGHWRYRRVDMVKQAIEYVRVLAGYECASVEQNAEDSGVCGKCGPCEANMFLRRWGIGL